MFSTVNQNSDRVQNKYIMVIHPIHDLNNSKVIRILSTAMYSIKEEHTIQNYHPDFANVPGNLFYILREGRYKANSGTYFVLEEDGKFISSAGWNEYPLEWKTALLLTRAYVSPEYRGNFTVGKYILPIVYGESQIYNTKLWITFGKRNERYLKFFEVAKTGKIKLPELYKKFNYIGQKSIYYTNQHVVENIVTK